MEIGNIIRLLRGNMTQAELSRRCGVDKAIISKIETGKMAGTIESHKRLAKVFGLTLSELYAYIEKRPPPVEFHPRDMTTDTYGAFLQILTAMPLSKKMLPVFISLEPGEVQYLEETEKKVERFIIIVEGTAEIENEGMCFTLEKKKGIGKGDSIYSRSLERHILKNPGKTTACMLCISAPPVL